MLMNERNTRIDNLSTVTRLSSEELLSSALTMPIPVKKNDGQIQILQKFVSKF